MKHFLYSSFFMLILVVVLFAKGTFVTTLNETCTIYSDSKGTTVLTSVKKGIPLELLDKKGKFYKIKTDNGSEGWIKKNDAALASSSTVDVATADTVKYDDNGMSPGVIIEGGEAETYDPIEPERSFKDAIKNNVNKEASLAK